MLFRVRKMFSCREPLHIALQGKNWVSTVGTKVSSNVYQCLTVLLAARTQSLTN